MQHSDSGKNSITGGEAATGVFAPITGDGLIRAQIESRRVIPFFERKSKYGKELAGQAAEIINEVI